MENGNTEAINNIPGKKELKKQLAEKMEAALPELRTMLGEKKFEHRLKKAAKLLIEGLHKSDIPKKEKQSVAKAAAKKGVGKKAANKKAFAKQAVVKATSLKKVKSAKK